MDQMIYNYDVCSGQYDELGLLDFMDEANFEQFIDLIRGEPKEPATTHEFCVNWDCNRVVLGYPQLIPVVSENIPDLHDLYEFNEVPDQNVGNQAQALPSNIGLLEEKPLTTKQKTKKSDRARTLISERKRRSSMKEKLYALRSLVPYVTKMDKASIIGDAIRYVQDLQMKTNKLKAEIADLESPARGVSSSNHRPAVPKTAIISPPVKQILQTKIFLCNF